MDIYTQLKNQSANKISQNHYGKLLCKIINSMCELHYSCTACIVFISFEVSWHLVFYSIIACSSTINQFSTMTARDGIVRVKMELDKLCLTLSMPKGGGGGLGYISDGEVWTLSLEKKFAT